jgi:hypothetical protein
LNGAKVIACAQKLNMGSDMEKLKQIFSDPNHPKEVCARLCIYQAMELVDDNFELNVSISGFKRILKMSKTLIFLSRNRNSPCFLNKLDIQWIIPCLMTA